MRTRAPYSIIIAAVSNSVMLFAFVICLLFCIGNLEKVQSTPTALPLIEVYYEATKSKAYTNALVAMPAIILFFTLFNVFASVSRLIWVFAKDKGLPFSKTFSYVSVSLMQAKAKSSPKRLDPGTSYAKAATERSCSRRCC